MKHLMVSVFVQLALTSSLAMSQEVGPVRYITVSGFAETWVVPDVAVWSVTIEKSNDGLRDLQEASNEELARLVGLTRSLGVATDDVKIGQFIVNKQYKRDKHGNRKGFSHYSLRRNVSVTQRDFSRFEEFMDSLMFEGDLSVQLGYQSTVMDSVRYELKLQAVDAARRKALGMAGVLGATVGEPLIISEYPIITDAHHVEDRLSREAGIFFRLKPENIHVKQTAHIRFRLVDGTEQ